MSSETDDIPVAKPKTTTVLGLLVLTSLTFSYLAAYALSGTLVHAEIIRPWPAGADPRPRWLAIGFVLLLVAFVSVAAVVRSLSRRQLREIDEMGEGEAG